MKFREYSDLKTIILIGKTGTELSDKINEFGLTHDIVDLQYSSHFHNTLNVEQYSALILFKDDYEI